MKKLKTVTELLVALAALITAIVKSFLCYVKVWWVGVSALTCHPLLNFKRAQNQSIQRTATASADFYVVSKINNRRERHGHMYPIYN